MIIEIVIALAIFFIALPLALVAFGCFISAMFDSMENFLMCNIIIIVIGFVLIDAVTR